MRKTPIIVEPEFVETKKTDLEWFESHPHTIQARRFLDRIKRLGSTDGLFFAADDDNRMRVENKLRVRLWRYAEVGEIGYREFNVLKVKGGLSVIRNLDPVDDRKKRNLRRVGRAV